MSTSLISTGSYQAYTQFLGTNQPYILPATFTYNGDQNINIPSVYGSLPPLGKSDANILVDTNPPAGSRANTDFQLSWIAGSTTPTPTGTTELTTIAQVTIKGNNCWKLDKPSRQQLRTSWAVFSDKLDALEMKGYLFTGGAAIILQRIAEALPLSFKEMLTYRYNFNPSDRYIDLQAGMRLRVDFAAQQFIAPGSNINGFVGAGYYEFFCQIRDINGNPRLTFDAFSGNMAAMDRQLPLGEIASVVDLQGIDTSRRYWRLFYPAQIPSGVGNGIRIPHEY